MYQLSKEEMYRIESFFQGWEETMIWSCLQGYMGKAWTDDPVNPISVQIITGDFCFFAGEPREELVRNIPKNHPSKWILMAPPNEEWSALIEKVYPTNSNRFLRYAIKKEPNIFDKKHLQIFIDRLPKEYQLKFIDEELYHKLLSEEWSRDLCSQFPTCEAYQRYGIGVVALFGDIPVSGASSYTVYDKGIEIEIDTKNEYRRKGLAQACASKLILACLERNLYPSWDAHDLRSVALAEKLGYHLDKEYVTYSVAL